MSPPVRVLGIAPALAVLLLALLAGATTGRAGERVSYFVDCEEGSDAAAGTSPAGAWRSLAPVSSLAPAPGAAVHLRRGCRWEGRLRVRAGGTPEEPVLYTTYGEGAAPVVANPGGGAGKPALDVRAAHVIIDGLAVADVPGPGIWIRPGADHVVVRDVEVSDAGIGVRSDASASRITRAYVHDLHMVVNTPGGDDDFGASCFWFTSGPVELSHSLGQRCRAPSHDYGYDGGFVEAWQDAHDLSIHHNRAEGTRGFLEAGSLGGAVRDVTMAFNVLWETDGALCLHDAGRFATQLSGISLDNTTYASTWSERPVFDCMRRADGSSLVVRNSIFATRERIGLAEASVHRHNLYYLPDGGGRGFPLGDGE